MANAADADSVPVDAATLASRSEVAASRAALQRVRSMLATDAASFRIAALLPAANGGTVTVSRFAFLYRQHRRQSGRTKRR